MKRPKSKPPGEFECVRGMYTHSFGTHKFWRETEGGCGLGKISYTVDLIISPRFLFLLFLILFFIPPFLRGHWLPVRYQHPFWLFIRTSFPSKKSLSKSMSTNRKKKTKARVNDYCIFTWSYEALLVASWAMKIEFEINLANTLISCNSKRRHPF